MKEESEKQANKGKVISQRILIIVFVLTILNTLSIIAGAVFLFNYDRSIIILQSGESSVKQENKTEENSFLSQPDPMFGNFHFASQQEKIARTQIRLLEDSILAYRMDMGDYPAPEEGLQALIKNPGKDKWKGPYLAGKIPKDPWGNDYIYTCPGENGDFDIRSYGADGKPGGTGKNADIKN